MDSIYGRDSSSYWVKVVYDSGREETHTNLELNQAYELKNKKEEERRSQHQSWKYQSLKEHIQIVEAGKR